MSAGGIIWGSAKICNDLVAAMNKLVLKKFEILAPYFKALRETIEQYMNKKGITIKKLFLNDYLECLDLVSKQVDKDLLQLFSRLEHGGYLAIPVGTNPARYLSTPKGKMVLTQLNSLMKTILGNEICQQIPLNYVDIGLTLKELVGKHLGNATPNKCYIVGIELVSFHSISRGYYNPTMMLFNGKPRVGESLNVTALREIREETGIDFSNIISQQRQLEIRKTLSQNLPISTICTSYGYSLYYLIAINNSIKIRYLTNPEILPELVVS